MRLKRTVYTVCYSYQCWFTGLQASGRRSRTTSESSTHSGGRERSNSAIKQASPPPPSIPEQPRKEEAKKAKKDSPKKVNIYTHTYSDLQPVLLKCSPVFSEISCLLHAGRWRWCSLAEMDLLGREKWGSLTRWWQQICMLHLFCIILF